MVRRKLEELNVMDNFLFQQLVSRGEEGEDFCRRLLEPILGKKIGKIKIAPQKPFAGLDTDLHGIRLDAYVEVAEPDIDMEIDSEIYDIEPNQTVERERLPKRTRFYQGLIDARLLEGGWDYRQLKKVVIIMILPYDPFGKNRMVYTVKNQCVEDSTVEYEDGAIKIFLNTKGNALNTSQELQKMLKYIESSVAENVTDENIQAIHNYVKEVKKDKEVEVQYMKSWEVEQLIREEAQAE
ncbi:MAG: Rpn family recombination-promoting nuclease/putative transposase, partial [Lachnospiraceae bacterium]|nr:Rpn family recombination-promoting nuclease/putative transposase [Lachnospiraceae bacterium]